MLYTFLQFNIYLIYNSSLYILCIYFKGNLLIMAAILCSEKLRKASSSVIIFSLSVAHFSISSFVNTFGLVGFLYGEAYFNKHFGLCQFVAIICITSSLGAFLKVVFLAYERYILNIFAL